MRINIGIILFAFLLFNFHMGFSSPRVDTKQHAFDFLINLLDTSKIDRKGEMVKFNKDQHKIYYVDPSLEDDQINFKCCNYNIPDFILVDSIFHKKIRNNGNFKSESSPNSIKLRQPYIHKSTYEDFKKTHLSGDIYMVMGGSFTLGLYTYVHIYFGFGDWIHHDCFIKLDNNSKVLDYVICTGVE